MKFSQLLFCLLLTFSVGCGSGGGSATSKMNEEELKQATQALDAEIDAAESANN